MGKVQEKRSRMLRTGSAVWAAVLAMAGGAGWMRAQTAAPGPQRPVGDPTLVPRLAVPAQTPPAGAAAPAAKPTFPPVDPKNFTVSSPSPETVNSFLHALWGYDPNRIWSVYAIQPTTAPGVIRVQAYVADKAQPARVAGVTLYITPDGKHVIAGDVAPFGAQPFAETRTLLQQQADGPARGAASKEFEVVEFADLQCPNCKAAQGTMDQLVQDFPQMHFVYQNLPLTSVHPYAMEAAEVGQCVRQAKGDPAFFVYAGKVYDTQVNLTKEQAEATLRAAVTAAGADPEAAMRCANAPETATAVARSVKLAESLGINATPTLVVNGRIVPVSQVPYEVLKRVVVFQGSLDGVTIEQKPSLSTLK